jgi:AcrR family transcriptional regulator
MAGPDDNASKTERTRDALRHAALARFLDQGVQRTTVAEIAADAGVTERTFYRHYPSKQHILFADYDARLDWFRKALQVRPPTEPITHSVRVAVESFPYDDALRTIAKLRSRELERAHISTHLRRLQAEFAHEIEGHLELRAASTIDDTLITRLTAQFISAAMFTAVETWLNNDNSDLDELARLTDLAIATLNQGIR